MLRKITSFRDYFLCVLSACFLIFSFPNFNLWILAWFGFVPLFFALQGKPKIKAFLLSYLTGLIFWFGTVYWLIHVTLPGMIILVMYLALYFGIFGLIISSIQHPTSNIRLLFIPSLWVLLEYLRSHFFTGFPWALLSYSQYLNLPAIQIADITGCWGVSFLVMLVNVAVYLYFARRKKYLLPLLCVIISLSYGYYKLYRTTNYQPQTTVRISVIQGNITQELKWDPAAKRYIVEKYLMLTKEALKANPDLIIWPEAALPVVLEEEPEFFERIKEFIQEINIPLFLGAVTFRGNLYHNSALLVSQKDVLQYDKLHLVPFGEYIPFRKTFSFLEAVVPIGDFSRGKEYTLFVLPTPNTQHPAYFAALICFEDLFPELARNFTKKGADFLVNITNDAWFKKTSSPYQHFSASVLRAVENRVSVVRAANTGLSGFIAPSGEVISLVKDKDARDIFTDGYKTENIFVRPRRNLTFYSRYGDFFILICFLFAFHGIILPRKKTR